MIAARLQNLAKSPLVGRWLVAGAVLLVEYLFVSLRFDAYTIITRGGPWRFLAYIGMIAPLGACVAAAAVLLRTRSSAETGELARPGVPWFLAHALLFVGFLLTTAYVFDPERTPIGPAVLWAIGWVVLACAAPLALLVALFGSQALWRQLFSKTVLAALLVGLLAWVAGNFTLDLWIPLSRATLTVVASGLRLFSSDVVSDPDQLLLGLDGFSITVAPVCSGFEGMGLIAVLMTGYLVAFRSRLRFPRALWLVPLGIATVWLGNAVRIGSLMAVGAYFDEDVAHGAFHSKAGWVLFCAVALAIAALGHRSSIFSRAEPSEGRSTSEEYDNPTAVFLLPLLGLLGTAMVTGMFVDEIDYAYGLRVLVAGGLLYHFRSHYRALEAPRSWLAPLAGALIAVAWLGSARLLGEPSRPPPESLTALPAGVAAVWVVLRVLGSVVIVPICEELAFRGFLLRRLIARDFTAVAFTAWTPLAIIGSSLVFGVVHHRWIAATLAGAAYALVQIRTGRVSDAIVAHASTNGAIAVWVLLSGDWSDWI